MKSNQQSSLIPGVKKMSTAFKGLVVVITGAGSGIGLAVAKN